MDKKYIGKTLQLPKDTAALMDEYKKRLEDRIGGGVALSYSQVIHHALAKALEQ